jgi:hypothetical protein
LGLSSRHLGYGRLIVLTADLDGNAREGRAVRTRYLLFDKLGAPAESPDREPPESKTKTEGQAKPKTKPKTKAGAKRGR